MIRALSILAAVAALGVAAVPAASAGKLEDTMTSGYSVKGQSTAKAPRAGVQGFSIDIGTSEKLTALRLTAITDGTSNTLAFGA